MHKHLTIVLWLSLLFFVAFVTIKQLTLPSTTSCTDLQYDESFISLLQNRDNLVDHIQSYYLLNKGDVRDLGVNRFEWDVDDKRYSLYLREEQTWILHIEWLLDWRIQNKNYQSTNINLGNIRSCFGQPEYYIAELLQGTQANRFRLSVIYPNLNTIVNHNTYGIKDVQITDETKIDSITIMSARVFEETILQESRSSILQLWTGDLSRLTITDKSNND